MGCVLATFMLTPTPDSVLRQDCHPVSTGDFATLLRRTGRGGLDGSGGTLSRHSRIRAVGYGCSVVLFGESPDEIIAKVTMSSKVAGRQTVPRAEIWALFCMLQVWDGAYSLEIVTDASYTVYGMMEGNRCNHLRGTNGDLWRLTYQELDTKDRNPFLIKVKSHIDGKQIYQHQTPYWQIGLN